MVLLGNLVFEFSKSVALYLLLSDCTPDTGRCHEYVADSIRMAIIIIKPPQYKYDIPGILILTYTSV